KCISSIRMCMQLLLGGIVNSPLISFRWWRNPRDLHSFPTRRSSDLHRIGGDSMSGDGDRPDAVGADKPHPAVAKTGARTERGARSEEHTSELQSQSNLVCRLLLEKKKVMCWSL